MIRGVNIYECETAARSFLTAVVEWALQLSMCSATFRTWTMLCRASVFFDLAGEEDMPKPSMVALLIMCEIHPSPRTPRIFRNANFNFEPLSVTAPATMVQSRPYSVNVCSAHSLTRPPTVSAVRAGAGLYCLTANRKLFSVKSSFSRNTRRPVRRGAKRKGECASGKKQTVALARFFLAKCCAGRKEGREGGFVDTCSGGIVMYVAPT